MTQQAVEEVLWVMKRWISRRNEARDRRRPGRPPRIEQRSAGAKDALQRPNDFFDGLSASRRDSSLMRQQPFLAPHAAGVADRLAVAPDHAVAGDQQRDAVVAVRA